MRKANKWYSKAEECMPIISCIPRSNTNDYLIRFYATLNPVFPVYCRNQYSDFHRSNCV